MAIADRPVFHTRCHAAILELVGTGAVIVKTAVHLPESVDISLKVALLLWRDAFKLASKIGFESIQHISNHMRESRHIAREAHLSPWQNVTAIGVDETDAARALEKNNLLEIVLHPR